MQDKSCGWGGVNEQKKAVLADGSYRKCGLAGPVDVRFANRSASCRALVLPGADEVLFGVIPLEEMDVIIDPIRSNWLSIQTGRTVHS